MSLNLTHLTVDWERNRYNAASVNAAAQLYFREWLDAEGKPRIEVSRLRYFETWKEAREVDYAV